MEEPNLDKSVKGQIQTESIGKVENDDNEIDAADFLLANAKYHNCFLTVGNPETEQIERIGVASSHLVINSPVFRNMLDKQVDLPNTNIVVSDVSPSTFKLLLRYLYGGKLPKTTAIETSALVLCADKYKIPRLVEETLKQLNPTNSEDVFPALICVPYTSFPDLEDRVTKIVQRETDKIVEKAGFLKLNEASLVFILKQNVLKINEVELWKNVVRWAEHQVEVNPTRPVRDCFMKILGYVRFLTFTSDEILEHVLPADVLSGDEFMDLVRAVTTKQPLKSSVLCSVREKRGIFQEEKAIPQSTLDKTESKLSRDESLSQKQSVKQLENVVFDKLCVFRVSDHLKIDIADCSLFSHIYIKPCKLVEIVSFTCKSINGKENFKYKYNCKIKISKTKGEYHYEQYICVEGSAVSNDEIVLSLKFANGKPIVINPEEEWCFATIWDSSHPTHHQILATDGTWGKVKATSLPPIEDENVTIQYYGPFHVVQVAYKTQ